MDACLAFEAWGKTVLEPGSDFIAYSAGVCSKTREKVHKLGSAESAIYFVNLECAHGNY